MSHEIDASNGRDNIAYAGETPWHGLGQLLTPDADLDQWRIQAGLNWEARKAAVQFSRQVSDTESVPSAFPDRHVLYRSDTGAPLNVVSSMYRPVQPKQVIEFYRDLTEQYGYKMETAGSLAGGRKIWALANCEQRIDLPGDTAADDTIRAYLLLATSFDGSMSTQAFFTPIRVVCANTMRMALDDDGRKAGVSVPHSTEFKADKVKTDLKIGAAWTRFAEQAERMAMTPVTREMELQVILKTYMGLNTPDEIKDYCDSKFRKVAVDKLVQRLASHLSDGPGALMRSAAGTAWGLLNAITFDIDHAIKAKSDDNRLNSAWFGRGADIKDAARDNILELIG